MIFWFSGTGNSQWVAQRLAATLNDTLIDVAQATLNQQHDYSLKPGESIGFVFPTHSWGPPPLVCSWAQSLNITGYGSSTHCYMVTTCGDDTGLTVEILQKSLGNITLNAAFSVQMPNTYICLPGFDVDNYDLEHSKLTAARARLEKIAMAIAERRNIIDVVRGSMPWIKSRIIRPIFVATLMSDSKFKCNKNVCTHCGTCAKQCPVNNISMSSDNTPQWQGNCTMCLRCLHLCPARAIDYGTATQKKGRYHFKQK